MSEWIPVSERLPRSRREVLVYGRNSTFREGMFQSYRFYWAKEKWSWSRLDGGSYGEGVITHWQPLPPPPTTGRE